MVVKAQTWLWLLLLFVPQVLALEVSGQVSAEFDYFFSESDTSDWQTNASVLGEFRVTGMALQTGRWVFGASGVADDKDPERDRVSIEDAYVQQWFGKGWSARIGYLETFWGVTEASNPVNVLNQTRVKDDLEGDVKITQPMLNVTHDTGERIINLYLLTGFEKRQYAGRNGRPSLPLYVDSSDPLYEREPGIDQWDAAVRSQWLFGNLELALSYFHGLAREPGFDLRISEAEAQHLMLTGELPADHDVALVPEYDRLRQAGLEATVFSGDTQWKGEIAHRALTRSDHWRGAVGLEHGFYGVFNSRFDASLYIEYLFDTQESRIDPLLDNDVFVGTKFDLNDASSTTFEVGLIVDLESSDSFLNFETETRLLDNFVVAFSGQGFFSDGEDYTPEKFVKVLLQEGEIEQPLALYQSESQVTLRVSYYW